MNATTVERLMRRGVLVGALVGALATTVVSASCGPRKNQAPQRSEAGVAWRQLGSWSGRGSLQTESFTSDTGTLRVRWETTPTDSDTAEVAPAAFRLDAHSAISGRLLQQVVDRAGAGHGIDYVQQDPHVFYIVVESSRLNWRFTVDEAIGYP
jgi:hypothetical protein